MRLLIRSRDYVRSRSSGTSHKTLYYPTVKAFASVSLPLKARVAPEAASRAITELPSALLRAAFQRPMAKGA